MKNWNVAAVLVACLTLGGCVSAGTDVSEAQMSQFQKGITTESQVIAQLGRATATSQRADGTTILVYSYAKGTPDAIDYVPVVGMFAGGATGTNTTVTFMFSPDGLLKDFTRTTSTVHSSIMGDSH